MLCVHSNMWDPRQVQALLHLAQRNWRMSFDIDHCNEDMDIDIPLDFGSKAQEVTDYRFAHSILFSIGVTSAESILLPPAR